MSKNSFNSRLALLRNTNHLTYSSLFNLAKENMTNENISHRQFNNEILKLVFADFALGLVKPLAFTDDLFHP